MPTSPRTGDIPCLRARVTFGHCPKSDQKDSQKPRFLDFLHAVASANLPPFTTRSQDRVVIVTDDALTFFLRRCRSCASTVGNGPLYGGAMRASRPTEFYRRLAVGRGRGVKKTCRWHVFSLRSRRLCRRSIYLIFEGTTSPRRTVDAEEFSPYRISGSGAGAETIRS